MNRAVCDNRIVASSYIALLVLLKTELQEIQKNSRGDSGEKLSLKKRSNANELRSRSLFV